MLVYGDHKEIADPRERFDLVFDGLRLVAEMPPGIERHAKLVAALIAAGQLLQGLADQGWTTNEIDELLYALAACVVRSSDTDFADFGELPWVSLGELPKRVELRLPEGFAFYAVYPEAYAAAARKLRLNGPPRVIGIRTIGTTLGTVTAAALNAPVPTTVRPFGDPFARQVDLPEEVIDANAHYLIVDEGPGLSGSSFGAVADWLEARGVPLQRIAFLPSHAGAPGPHASEAHIKRWSEAQRIAATFDPVFLEERFGPLEQYSAGGPSQRLKYLGWRRGERVLLKFAGLGEIGERKFEMARALQGAGLTPEPLEFVHGFLAERWHDDALRLAAEDKPIRQIGEYIGARARLFPAEASSGATIADLLAMCRRNLSLAFDDDTARTIDRWNADALSAGLQRVRTDNKLDRDEWLRLPDGRLLKTDAVDHHCGHDLIGCQDMAWDVAGAIVEFALDDEGARRLVEASERAAGRPLHGGLLDLYRVAYCCFRLGQARLWRLSSRAVHYETAVMPLLKDNYCCFTSQKSLVD